MTGTTVSVTAVVLLLAAGLSLEVSARRRGSPAPLAQALSAAMRTTPGRLAVLLAWAWLGVHFLAR
ncbi:DUF6186 family protein [Geodermatophilus arenarius]|uniref:DUF6186 family protein n=1 Tax=Geodermatophilus arenarius TaxID=1137990 RepID=A0ABV9LLD0_9ACTN